MLRITQNSTAEGAKSYYSTADYYTEGQELIGSWRGHGAERLGLHGTVERQQWDSLCDNRDPSTGRTLTARQKQNRRIGYDFNFHVPKSVSVLFGMTGDERILSAFRDAVEATMEDIEAEMKTRVRVGGRDEDRVTGNVVYGEFIHFAARPVAGVPDPHLHAHCFVFNSTWDEKEQRWKAAQFGDIKADARYFEALFHSRLARGMEELGLSVARKRKGWELEAMPESVRRKFSRRTQLIEEKAQSQGILDAKTKSELGAKTRERKDKFARLSDTRETWNARLSEAEREAIHAIAERIGGPPIAENPRAIQEAASLAVEHCFERRSVVTARELEEQALRRAWGSGAPDAVHKAVADPSLIRHERDGQILVTTDAVLSEERRMIDFARNGRGTCAPLTATPHMFQRDWLNAEQRRAVQHVLDSRDRVTLVRGAAGTGKTSTLQEAAEAIEATGRHLFVFAPSADAARGVLRDEAGFADADTVARLLVDERLQSSIHGQVIWVDEAGLLGTKTMAQLFDLADERDARVVLSGDRRQHGSVERGAALRLLEEEAGVIPAEIREIQRQKGAYKEVVRALSEGRTAAGFRQLDKLGWIREVKDSERYRVLAEDYLATVKAGDSALVVCPTHLEGEWATEEIREKLKAAGRFGTDERPFLILENANLTEADRRDTACYRPGDVLVFHQNAKGVRKGARLTAGNDPLPLEQAARFAVFHRATLNLAPGDLIRVTRNGFTADRKHRLSNGAIYRVKDFDRRGDIILNNDWVVGKEYGHLAHGYVVTSHASQGKTVDRVLVAQSFNSLRASSREQFYVSVSRGKRSATIYTDDKCALLEAVDRSDLRLSATELTTERDRRDRAQTLQRLAQLLPAFHEVVRKEARERATYVR